MTTLTIALFVMTILYSGSNFIWYALYRIVVDGYYKENRELRKKNFELLEIINSNIPDKYTFRVHKN